MLSNPDQLDALRNDRSLMPQAIEEGLRWEPPLIGIMRTATRDTEVEGVFVPAGSIVAVNIGSANHDEKYWDNPEKFDIFRPPRQHLAFAWGPHMCLGLHLARMETRVVLTQLLDRLPGLRFDPDAEAAADHRRDLPGPGVAAGDVGLTRRTLTTRRQRSSKGARPCASKTSSSSASTTTRSSRPICSKGASRRSTPTSRRARAQGQPDDRRSTCGSSWARSSRTSG